MIVPVRSNRRISCSAATIRVETVLSALAIAIRGNLLQQGLQPVRIGESRFEGTKWSY